MPRNGTSLHARRPSRAVLDVGLAVVIAIVCVRSLVPRRALIALWPATELNPWIVVALVLLAVRIAVATRSGERAGLAPGSWFGALRPPALLLAAAFAFTLASRPPTATPMGADEPPYLRQLAGLFLQGRLAEAGLEPGPTLLWGPVYLLAHAVTLVLRAAGFDVPADGSSEPYRNAVRLGSALCALAAASLAWLICRRFFPPLLAAVCVVGFWLGSPLFYYSWAEPAMAHAPAAALTSLLVWLWLRVRDSGAGAPTWIATGIVAGLLVSTQRYDVYFLLLPLSVVAGVLVTRTGSPLTPSRHRLVAAAAVAGLLAIVPLLLVSLRSSDAFLVNPAAIGRLFLSEWRRPHVAEVLFSSNGGLFAWTPLALVGVVGLLGFARRQPRTALPLLGALGLGILLLSSNGHWWAGWSFGARRLTEAFPVFALGLCAAAEWLLRRPALVATAGLGALVALNLSWSDQTRIGNIPRGDAVSFSVAGTAALESVHGVLGHPFSWPMPWVFAWRYGVAPGQADTLFGRVPRDRWDLRIGLAGDAAILGRGWSRPAEDDSGAPFRWSRGPVSTLLVTLTPPETRVLEFSASAVRGPTDLPQALDLYVNGRLLRRFELPPTPTEHVLIVRREFWVVGLNEIALRSAWQLGSSDARALGEAPNSGFRVGAFSLRPLRATPG